MSYFGVWITAIWILLFAIFNVAFSSYSEDQCSWRGRQVFSYDRVSCVLAAWKDDSKKPLREATGVSSLFVKASGPLGEGQCLFGCNMLRLAIRAQLKCF